MPRNRHSPRAFSDGYLIALGSRMCKPIHNSKTKHRYPLSLLPQNTTIQEKSRHIPPINLSQLPQEVLDEIASYVGGSTALVLVCRSLSKPATRTLYRHIIFRPLVEANKVTLEKLMETLRLREDYFPFIRLLEIDLTSWKSTSHSALNWVSISLGELLTGTSALRRLVFMCPYEWPEVKQELQGMTCAFLAFGAGRGLNKNLALDSLATNLNPAELNLCGFLDDQEQHLKSLVLSYNHKQLHYPKEPIYPKSKTTSTFAFSKLSELKLIGSAALFHLPMFINPYNCISTLALDLSYFQTYDSLSAALSSTLALKNLTLLGTVHKISTALEILAKYPLMSLELDTLNKFYTTDVFSLDLLSQTLNTRIIHCRGVVPFEREMKAYFANAPIPINRPDKIVFEPSSGCAMVKSGFQVVVGGEGEKEFWIIEAI